MAITIRSVNYSPAQLFLGQRLKGVIPIINNRLKPSKVNAYKVKRSVAVFGGLYAFVLSKRYIDKTRYESMKVRERIRQSNLAQYSPTRKFSD